jgi:predicted nuclease with TOPRIM domain
MKRLKKFQKEKAVIEERLQMLQDKIEKSENADEIVEALEKYQDKLTGALKLN